MTIRRIEIGRLGLTLAKTLRLGLTRYSRGYPQAWELWIGPVCIEWYRNDQER